MNIRYRISLWITGVGLLSSLVFSLVCFLEMREQPYELVDVELATAAESILTIMNRQTTGREEALAEIDSLFGSHYWIKMYDVSRRQIYRSALANGIELFPGDRDMPGATLVGSAKGPEAATNNSSIPFRAHVLTTTGSEPMLLQVARPIARLESEITDLLLSLALGLVTSTILLIVLSYFVAGRILQPVRTITRLAREITDRTLDQRIPLPESRDELHDLASALNRMFDRLQLSFARQKEFLANASHELKNPTAMLRLFFDEMTQHRDLPELLQRQFADQSAVLSRMERLIRMLLELSVLEMKQSLDLEEMDLAGLCREVVAEFGPFLEGRNIAMRIMGPETAPMIGDREKIRRMLINVVDNAIRYNTDGGWIRLSIIEGANGIQILLANSGPGIPPEELEAVFRQFHRLEKSRSQGFGGSGLGLTISREIVLLHGGTISLENGDHEETILRVFLPKRPRHCL